MRRDPCMMRQLRWKVNHMSFDVDALPTVASVDGMFSLLVFLPSLSPSKEDLWSLIHRIVP